MLALELNKTMVKSFMGQILREEIFDSFEVRSVELATLTRISIDGGLAEGFVSWQALRPLIYTIIKASLKPRHVKIIFSYRASEAVRIHPNAAALFLNLIYENDGVTFTTATAQKEFALDKTLDTAWDEWMIKFFAQKGLDVTDRV